MSDSTLVTYEKLCKNKTVVPGKRNLYIIPHCYVGQVTAQRGVDAFYNRNNASCQYVVGYDGSIGQSVLEQDRSWCTGGDKTLRNSYGNFTGRDMDFCSVTIEVASDNFAPYAITNEAYAALVNLMADIAKRNGIGELKWRNDSSLVGNPEQQNVAVHRWFASKACPGDYIMGELGKICSLANDVIRTGIPFTPQPTSDVAKPTLKKGMRGQEVKKLQQNLISLGFSCGVCGADGDFGNGTRSAVIEFQKKSFPDNPSEWDGIYGPKSYAKMKEHF